MSDPLDDLRAVLQRVEPSPAFERNTRERIERGQARTGKRAWWFMVPMAAAAAVVVTIVATRSSGEVGDHSALRGGPGSQSALPDPAIVLPAIARVKHATRPRAARASRASEPSWTVPENAQADQAIGVRRLMTLIREGKVKVPGDAIVFDDSGPVPVLPPVELKPIVITPLPHGQGGGSER